MPSDDKSRSDKLKSYDTKDYSEVIDFPVELVDRDGVVRRYSYEESLAVYHRRIQSAPWRYTDEDLIRAEVGHCSARIDQIKRSYAHRATTGLANATVNPRACLGSGYDLIRQFYRAALSDRSLVVDGELPIRLSLLDDQATCRTYHVGFNGGHSEHLLYVYPFDRIGDGDPKAAFGAARDRFRGQAAAAGVEGMLMAEETSEAGFLLTGSSEVPAGLRDLAREARPQLMTGPDGPPPEPSSVVDWIFEESAQPWWAQNRESDDEEPRRSDFELGVIALREERHDEALERFRLAVERNPWHREAYLALLAVLDGAGLHDEAEMYGAMAGHYLQDDGLVRYRQGINLVRQGRLGEAVTCFDDACDMDGSLYQPSYFAAHVLVARGKDLDGAIARMSTAARAAPEELGLARLHRSLVNTRRLRLAMHWIGLALSLAAVLLVAEGVGWAWPAVPLGVLSFLLARPLTAALARVLVRRQVAPPGEVVTDPE